jgi:hypothetical protein
LPSKSAKIRNVFPDLSLDLLLFFLIGQPDKGLQFARKRTQERLKELNPEFPD